MIKTDANGFTIVELMIATTVLSVILLLSTVMISSIGNLYYKGINQSRVQDDVRTITDSVTQALQYTDKTPIFVTNNETVGSNSYSVTAMCVGTVRFTYVTDVQIGSDPTSQIPHVIWRDSFYNTCAPADLTASVPSTGSGGQEMMSPNSRLTQFDISNTSPYNITIGAAYGDSDLLTGTGADTTCKGSGGDQFCAVSSLTTAADKRVSGS